MIEAGNVFGRLTVITAYPPRRPALALVLCECGEVRNVRPYHLRVGSVRSCGCRQGRWSHGGARTKEYHVWAGMLGRCGNSNHPAARDYGARGIRVCDRWQAFENFIADMGPRPSSAHSIDRIDSNGDYEPGNCRWATRVEQNNNTSRNVMIEHEGRSLTLAEWAREIGVPYGLLSHRYQRGERGAKLLGPRRLTR